jgi:hypothetical protein
MVRIGGRATDRERCINTRAAMQRLRLLMSGLAHSAGESFRQSDAAALLQAQNTSIASGTHSIDDLVPERYAKMRSVAQTYAIIQIGLCLFHRSPDGSYVARPFNYYIFPGTTRPFDAPFPPPLMTGRACMCCDACHRRL